MLQALWGTWGYSRKLVDFQNYIVAAVGKEKGWGWTSAVDADLKVEIETAYYDQLAKAVQEEELAREAATQVVKKKSLPLIKNALQKMKIWNHSVWW